ncbi:SDR family oxidoreductase [Tropicibacter sp. R16_0]|uniref:SDR family NAD(P)-dependent oxidoreductase n=1 Tax=Tropicibacter sp. R16_0 TaxID=2821102 RepID=UPI001ADCA953|nr:SDR family NAD(P)-dependent oxidoreductase [Tropicibacter sp. R16_0]MBO9449059.1 SDR family oxidoreductase [Tropicibacter sp. R16_0]
MTGPSFSLVGKTILITGAARGLGAAMAQACAAQGAQLCLQDINAQAVEATADALRVKGATVQTAAFDLTDFDVCTDWVQGIGPIWGLVNNAGITNHGHTLDQTIDDYRSIYDLHVFAPFLLAREAARVMQANPGPQRGRIVSISSIAATHPRPGIGNYASSKAAIAGLTRSLAADFGGDGICANAIAPGYVLTEMNRKILSDHSFVRRIENRTPAARWAEPAEIAAPVAFLMSEAASYINGQLLAIDGGMNAFLQSNEG